MQFTKMFNPSTNRTKKKQKHKNLCILTSIKVHQVDTQTNNIIHNKYMC